MKKDSGLKENKGGFFQFSVINVSKNDGRKLEMHCFIETEESLWVLQYKIQTGMKKITAT